jgi:vacuolar protein sorting-associated protein 72
MQAFLWVHVFSFLKEEPDKKRPNISSMGELFESVTSEYSTPKKRRIEAARSPISGDPRHGARFRRIPALDMMDED